MLPGSLDHLNYAPRDLSLGSVKLDSVAGHTAIQPISLIQHTHLHASCGGDAACWRGAGCSG